VHGRLPLQRPLSNSSSGSTGSTFTGSTCLVLVQLQLEQQQVPYEMHRQWQWRRELQQQVPTEVLFWLSLQCLRGLLCKEAE
jgi:hypothetical protein